VTFLFLVLWVLLFTIGPNVLVLLIERLRVDKSLISMLAISLLSRFISRPFKVGEVSVCLFSNL